MLRSGEGRMPSPHRASGSSRRVGQAVFRGRKGIPGKRVRTLTGSAPSAPRKRVRIPCRSGAHYVRRLDGGHLGLAVRAVLRGIARIKSPSVEHGDDAARRVSPHSMGAMSDDERCCVTSSPTCNPHPMRNAHRVQRNREAEERGTAGNGWSLSGDRSEPPATKPIFGGQAKGPPRVARG